ncbi:hypothetical protein HKX48_003951 [Thoreauomyces humboldtii]|nr:hypothetical protein HKX48_003951 [Thoreauomyces humboldtii]
MRKERSRGCAKYAFGAFSNPYLVLAVPPNIIVAELKDRILEEHKLLPGTGLRVAHAHRELDDHLPLSTCSILPEITLDPLPCPRRFMSFLPAELLDPDWDRDYTVAVDATIASRGGREYKRPIGWWRFGLNVKGKHGNDKWLGKPGPRNESSKGEWMVTYHGTSFKSAASIARHGYYSGPEWMRIDSYVPPCVWSTSNLAVTDSYSAKGHYMHEGVSFKVVMQNRVDPDHATNQGGGIFTAPRQYVRPYAILVQPMPHYS